MRLNLIIQRHGFPTSRILWSTSTSTAYIPASSSSITSTNNPNAVFSNGYTVAQLLDDVNEVVPLETEVEDRKNGSGSWGLEDYAVEVGGFECLHFMEVAGLLRDNDTVV